jgi:DNA polymerase I-like protein with 3'-5' exonuclease and polymerase domains
MSHIQQQVTAVLVDRRNYIQLAPVIKDMLSKTALVGFDIETHDADRHEGLNRAMKVDADGHKAGNKRLLFDHRRTTLCGLSLYCDGSPYSFYLNVGHSDAENRLDWSEVKDILDARSPQTYWVIHNSAFEIVMLRSSVGYTVERYIDTMMMAVSAYGPDEYDAQAFINADFAKVWPILDDARLVFAGWQPGEEMTSEQSDLFSKVAGKASDAAHSYNGLVASIAYGYGLKQAVKRWFGYEMTSFEQCLGGAAHMGQIPGEQVVGYGADDALWAVRLYHRLLQYMQSTNPAVISTYFRQELPVIDVFADMNWHGWRIDPGAVEAKRGDIRADQAACLRKLRATIRSLLPFPAEPNAGLMEHDSWFSKNEAWRRKRAAIIAWAELPDTPDDFEEVCRISGSIAEGWRGGKVKNQLNLPYWQTIRSLIYDLCNARPMRAKGKVQSDKDARGRLVERFKKEGNRERELTLIECLNHMATIEQVSKLYVEPYLNLVDPDTGRVYPVVSALLASRRMSMSSPNGQQLAKRGETTYVRGFFLPDDPDEELLMSMDWSAVELVLIAQESHDPVMCAAFSTIPYQDLHTGAAADTLRVTIPEVTEELLKKLNRLSVKEVEDINPKLLLNRAGEHMTPGDAKKYWRTKAGKDSNFNYWYSGALSTVGDNLGWNPDQMWKATEQYRSRFAVGEAWRQGVIAEGQNRGFITLPDGHRRVRWEATDDWKFWFLQKFQQWLKPEGSRAFLNELVRVIQRRAGNQLVNSKIQGTCATMMKRTLVKLRQASLASSKFRVVAAIHDEVVLSVKRRHLLEVRQLAKQIMLDHRDIVPDLPLHCTTSLGRTFEPYGKKAPFGQIELDEAPELPFLPKECWGEALSDDQIELVADYLMKKGTWYATVSSPQRRGDRRGGESQDAGGRPLQYDRYCPDL